MPSGLPSMPLKLSIITVCFNSEATIVRTLHSVAAQTWPNVEHIVIDGTSRDGTLALISSHRTARVSTVVSEPDKGVYDAMNKGVAAATGDVVAFLNADDFYADDGVLSRVAQAMDAEQLDALYGDVLFFSADDTGKTVRRYDSGRFRADRIAWGWMPAHPALFVRRALFLRYGSFRDDYRISGDFEFIARVFSNPGLRHRHWPEALVRMQLGGISTSGWRATLRLNREMMRACRDNGIPTNWFKLLWRYPFKMLEFLRR